MVKINSHKDRVIHRLKIASGHLQKIISMVDSETYCIDILHQSLAVQKALKQVDMLMMEEHLKTCAVEQVKNNEEDKMVEELIDIYKYK